MQPDATENPLGLALTARQTAALRLLISGKPHHEVARHVGIHRATLYRWRQFNPAFQAALNQHRDSLNTYAHDMLRYLFPQAIAVLARQLKDEGSIDKSTRAAMFILRVLPRLLPPPGPADEDKVLRQFALQERTSPASPTRQELDQARSTLLSLTRDLAPPYEPPPRS